MPKILQESRILDYSTLGAALSPNFSSITSSTVTATSSVITNVIDELTPGNGVDICSKINTDEIVEKTPANGIDISSTLNVDQINEKTLANGVDISSTLNVDQINELTVANGVDVSSTLNVDQINELTLANGVDISSILNVDEINERTVANGVDISSTLNVDQINERTVANGVDISSILNVDQINERTVANGVDISSILNVDEINERTASAGIKLSKEVSLESNKIINLATPTSNTDAATKSYVDSVAAGLDIKQSVRVATVIAGTLASDFENGDTVDGVVLVTGNRILIKNQASGVENGIYTVNGSGAPTRAVDLDTGVSSAGVALFTEEGTANAEIGFVCVNDVGSDVVGTDALVWTQFTAPPISSNDYKSSVRASTVVAGTLASDFENGDIIDGVTLVTGDRILIKNQASGTENGIYLVNTSGAPSRTSDTPVSSNCSGNIVFVEEGNVNKDRGFICTNNSGSDTVGTDALVYSRMTNSNTPLVVSNYTELSSAISAGETFIFLLAGTYTITSTLTIPSNTTLCGSGSNSTIFIPTGGLGANLLTTGSNDNITIKDIQFDGDSEASVNLIAIGDGSSDIRIIDCLFTGNAGSTDAIDATGSGSGISSIWIQTCDFDTIAGNGISQTAGDVYSTWFINNCRFTSVTGNPIDLNSLTRTMSINGCIFNTCGTIDLQGDTINFNNNIVIASTAPTIVNDGRITISSNFFRSITVDCLEIADAAGVETVNITGNHFYSFSANAIDVQCSSATAARINITGNNFESPVGGSAVSINIASNVAEGGSTGGNVLINGNIIESSSTGEGHIVVSSTGNPFVCVGTNALHQIESYTGSVTLDGYSDDILVTTTGVTTATLGDLSVGSKGHKVYIELEVDGGNMTLTPTSFADGTSLLFDDAGDYAILEWDGDLWHLVNNQTGNTVTETFTVGTTTNLDSNPTGGNERILRQSNEITLSGTYRCNPTASASVTSFRLTLPNAITFNATAATAALEATISVTGWYDATTPTSLSNVFASPVANTSAILISFTSSGSMASQGWIHLSYQLLSSVNLNTTRCI